MITLCIPSRGRPKLAKRMYDSAMAQSKAKKNLEFLFYLNEDDNSLPEYLNLLNNLPQIKIEVGPHQSTCFSWNKLAQRAKFDIVCLMGDDVQFETKKWDHKLLEEFDKCEDKILMVVPNTGRPRGYRESQWKSKELIRVLKKNETLPAPHFAVHKNWIKVLGYLCPPQFWHFYVDTYTQKVARSLGRCIFRKDIVWKVKKITDNTAHQVRTHLNIRNREDYVWSTCERHLQSDIDALRFFIKNYN